MKWHWGPPANPGEMRFHTGTLLSKPKGEPRMASKQYRGREIVGLFGISFGDVFLGRISLGQDGFVNMPPEPWKARRKRPLPDRSKEERG